MSSTTRSSSHPRYRLDPRRQPARKRAAQPRLEWLEGRTLLSTTFTVTNLHDSGDGSLRQAILDANTQSGADVIKFDSNLRGTITLTSGELDITTSLKINGPGADQLTISPCLG